MAYGVMMADPGTTSRIYDWMKSKISGQSNEGVGAGMGGEVGLVGEAAGCAGLIGPKKTKKARRKKKSPLKRTNRNSRTAPAARSKRSQRSRRSPNTKRCTGWKGVGAGMGGTVNPEWTRPAAKAPTFDPKWIMC